jgi:hypothetical protein
MGLCFVSQVGTPKAIVSYSQAADMNSPIRRQMTHAA